MKPSIGRIVHFFAPRYSIAPHLGGQPEKCELVPAIITGIYEEDYLVDLRILGGVEFGQEVRGIREADHDDSVPNTWAWPPRV